MDSVGEAPLAPLVATVGQLVQRSWLDIDTLEAVAVASKALHEASTRLKWRRKVVREQGFPSASRLRHWMRLGRIREHQQEVLKSKESCSAESYYLSLVGIQDPSMTASLESTGVEGEIYRDVQRTFPKLHFFTPEGTGVAQLGNVLKALAMHDPEVGYCQGMNYVAAVALLTMEGDQGDGPAPQLSQYSPQEAAFWTVIALMRHGGMADLWRKKMPGLSRCIYLYKQLLEKHFFELSVHLRHIGMHPSFLATQWFVTIFTRMLSVSAVARVWDLFLLDGWKMLFRLALAITARVEKQLLSMDMEKCSEFFRRNPKLGLDSCSPNDLIAESFRFKVTRSILRRMEEEMQIEYLRLRLQEAPLSHEHRLLFPALDANRSGITSKDRADVLAQIRSQLEHFDGDVANDSTVLQQKIEAADKELARATEALNTAAYALNEGMFEYAEQVEQRRLLRAQDQELTTAAVAAAMSPDAQQSGDGGRRRVKSVAYQLWRPPAAALEYINSRVLSCFERVAGVGIIASVSSTKEANDEPDDDEQEQALRYLEILVPQMAAEVRATRRKLAVVERDVDVVSARLAGLQRASQLAQVDLEEAQDFKDRLADQLLQIMLRSEQAKNERMQSLFASADKSDEVAQ